MMSTSQLARRCIQVAAIIATLAGNAHALELKPYKESLFAYPGILAQSANGAVLTVDYQKSRDIHQRDSEPELRVKGKYVDLGPRKMQLMTTLKTGGRSIDFVQVGQVKDANFVVVFIHGRGGDRRLGANDYRFGGNFNRLKNLAVDNGGLYLAPSIKSFDDNGYADVKALMAAVSSATPNGKVVLACASMGSIICSKATRDEALVSRLSGMMILGGMPDAGFKTSPAFKRKLPMFYSHGSLDTVYKSTDQLALVQSLVDQQYPARFVLFETGSHGTPVRMTDWRDSLNWIFRQ